MCKLELVEEGDVVAKIADYLERHVFFVDSRGYVTLKPKATDNYRRLLKALRAEACAAALLALIGEDDGN